MTPEIGKTYHGPAGTLYTVHDIEGEPTGLQWVVIRAAGDSGSIWFPMFDAGKWLKPIEEPAGRPVPHLSPGS